jgi:hypothetical protein
VIDEGDSVVHEDEELTLVQETPRLGNGLRPEDYQPRVLGINRNWFAVLRDRPGTRAFEVRRVAHPVRWWRWRRQVHRLGPYAPDYDDDGSSLP